MNDNPATAHLATDQRTLRLVWPQWQGAGPDVVGVLYPDVPLDEAQRGYALGSQLLNHLLPTHAGPTEEVPVTLDDTGLETRDGIYAKSAVQAGLKAAIEAIEKHDVDRVLTLGGECSVSVAPFAALAERYGDDLAVVWIDSHPDLGTPASEYDGYHAMALAMLLGHGDAELDALLPSHVAPERAAIAGLHAWTEDDIPHAAEWGVATFSPEDLRPSSQALIGWLRSTGCSKVAIHIDVDVVDSDETVFGLGIEPAGLRSDEVRRVVADLASVADVVGLTIAEFIPRQVLAMKRFLRGLPLID